MILNESDPGNRFIRWGLAFSSREVPIYAHSYILLFGAGVIIAWLLGRAAIRWLGPHGFLDVPGGRKLHRGAIPRVGGFAFAGTLVVGIAALGVPGYVSWPGAVGLSLIFVMGILDDRFTLRARWKALVGLCLAVWLAWMQAGQFVAHMGELRVATFLIPRDPLIVGLLLTSLYWVMPQAYNLIDGANGLALGCSIIVAVTLALAGTPKPLLLGSLVGVFLLNWPRAKCFMGDGGALTLGLLLALLAVRIFGGVRPDAILWLFAYPLADVFLVVSIRLATRQPLGVGDRNHFHHQWARILGKGERFAVPVLWGQVAICCSGALLDGAWRLIPFLGLVGLVAQVLVFSARAARGVLGKPLEHLPQGGGQPWARASVRGISDEL